MKRREPYQGTEYAAITQLLKGDTGNSQGTELQPQGANTDWGEGEFKETAM